MKTFETHLLGKRIAFLAERCVREQIPIVEFVQWYEEEGQYLFEAEYQPSFWGNVGSGALKGAGVGALTGIGAGVGAIGGGIAGAGKYAWDKFKQYHQGQQQQNPDFETTKDQAIQALTKLTQMNPSLAPKFTNLIDALSKMGDPAAAANAPTPASGGTPSGRTMSSYMQDRKLWTILNSGGLMLKGGEQQTSALIRTLVHNNIDATQLRKTVEKIKAQFTSEEEAVVAALGSLGIRNSQTGAYYKWNPTAKMIE